MNRLYLLICVSFAAFLVLGGYYTAENFIAVYFSDFYSNFEISIIFTSIYLSLAFFCLFSGTLVEKYGFKLSLIASSFFYGLFMIILSSSQNFVYLILGGISVGFGGSLLHIAGPTYVLEIAKRRGRYVGIFQGFTMLGPGLSGLIGGYYLLAHSYTSLFRVGAMLVFTALIFSFILKEKKRAHSKSDVKISVNDFFKILKNHDIQILAVLSFLGTFFFGISRAFVPLVAKELGASIFEIGIYGSTFTLSSLFVSVGGGELSDKIGRKPGFYLIILLSALCSFIIVIAQSVVLLILIGLLYSIVIALRQTMAISSIGDVLEDKRAVGNAIRMHFVCLGSVFGFLIGGIFSAENLRIPFVVMGVILLLSLLIVRKLKIR